MPKKVSANAKAMLTGIGAKEALAALEKADKADRIQQFRGWRKILAKSDDGQKILLQPADGDGGLWVKATSAIISGMD